MWTVGRSPIFLGTRPGQETFSPLLGQIYISHTLLHLENLDFRFLPPPPPLIYFPWKGRWHVEGWFLCSEEEIPIESTDSFVTKYTAPLAWGKSLALFCAEVNYVAVPLQRARFVDWEWQVVFLFEICNYEDTALIDGYVRLRSYHFTQLANCGGGGSGRLMSGNQHKFHVYYSRIFFSFNSPYCEFEETSIWKYVDKTEVVYRKHKTTEKWALHVNLGLFLYVSFPESSGMIPFLKDDPANLNVGPGA